MGRIARMDLQRVILAALYFVSASPCLHISHSQFTPT